VIVTVLPVRMMQVPFDQIIGMIAVHHSLMAAIRSMNVIRSMGPALVIRSTAILVRFARFQLVFVRVISMHMVEVAVVEVIGVAVVFHCSVSAIRTVHMPMLVLLHASVCHDFSFASRAPERLNRDSMAIMDPLDFRVQRAR
jgi:hypothetical protein